MNRFLLRLTSEIPLMLDDRLVALSAMRPEDVQAAAHPAVAKAKAALAPQYTINNGVAVLPIEGGLMQKPDFWDMALGFEEDVDMLTELVARAGADADAESVVLKIDSPGGMLTGGIELADAVAAVAKKKPVVAWTGGMAASLGYMVASQAQIIVTTRSAQVGSIGTILSVADWSKLYEGLGVKIHTFTNKEATVKTVTPMNEERERYLQDRVDKAFGMFRSRVTAKRPQIGADSMNGKLVTGEEGKRLGMVDRIGDLNFAISVARAEARARKRN